MMRSWVCAMCSLIFCSAHAAVDADLVTSLPEFPAFPFKSYSGFLNVTAPQPVAGYTSWVIHYQFDLSQNDPSVDPVVAWHTGGPGGSSVYGLYGELGYFLVSDSGYKVNPYSWNRIANMLYLEAPAGSFISPTDMQSGFSYCLVNGVRQETCTWDDRTQAEAYALTLLEFYKQYPEFAGHRLHLAGESYAGQYIPNIASHIIQHVPELAGILEGLLIGNGCWGGGSDIALCNGPNERRDKTDFYYGKGLLSKKMYDQIQRSCKFPDLHFTASEEANLSKECLALLSSAWDNEDAGFENTVVGPHDVFNIYNNCPDSSLSRSSLASSLKQPKSPAEGGYRWTCGQFSALPAYLGREDVRKALHLPEKSMSSMFNYNTSGPASVTLYPALIPKLRIVIYNGDADSSVPYNGNEAWTSGMEELGVVKEKTPWHGWFLPNLTAMPTGYATVYSIPDQQHSFTFVTLRLSGHEVPQFSPIQGWELFRRYIANEKF